MMKKIISVMALLALCIPAFAVDMPTTMMGADSSTGQTLKIGLIPSSDMRAILKAFVPVQNYLEKELNMTVETFSATNYTTVIDAMRVKKIDAGYFGSFSYVLAAQTANAEAIIAGGTPDGKVASSIPIS
jgi:phosphonate transport system substrate-binding protein